MLLRSWAMAIAALALAGCVSNGYAGSYDTYPDEAYYYDGPYYGGGLGYDSYFNDGYDRYFHPARNVTCDRSRDICYDRHGVSYQATARYLGERDANQAYKKYGDTVFLFSPRPGVTCDRRTQECSDGHWTDRLRRLEPGNIGSVGSAPRFADDDEPLLPVVPTLRNNDKAVNKRESPAVKVPPQRLANDDVEVARPSPRVTSGDSDRPTLRPRINSDKPSGGGGGNACPPLGCK
jgi:hypothetical protein